jgi:hypothetical protein
VLKNSSADCQSRNFSSDNNFFCKESNFCFCYSRFNAENTENLQKNKKKFFRTIIVTNIHNSCYAPAASFIFFSSLNAAFEAA